MPEPLPAELEKLLSSLESDTFYGRDYVMQEPRGPVAGSNPLSPPFKLIYTPFCMKKYASFYRNRSVQEVQFNKDYSVLSFSWKLEDGSDIFHGYNDKEGLKEDVLVFDPRWVMRIGEYMGKVGEFGYKFRVNQHVFPGTTSPCSTYAIIILDDGRLREMDLSLEFPERGEHELMAIEFRKNGFRH